MGILFAGSILCAGRCLISILCGSWNVRSHYFECCGVYEVNIVCPTMCNLFIGWRVRSPRSELGGLQNMRVLFCVPRDVQSLYFVAL